MVLVDVDQRGEMMEDGWMIFPLRFPNHPIIPVTTEAVWSAWTAGCGC